MPCTHRHHARSRFAHRGLSAHGRRARISRLSAIAVWVALPFAHLPLALAEEDPLAALAGPLFTEPRTTFPMSEQWRQRPIRHATSEPVDLTVVLDQQQYPALLPLIQEFRSRHDLQLWTSEGTCGTSAGALSRKLADIGGFCCAAGKADRLPGLRFHTVGIGPVAFIVHPSNPVDDISIGEARRIFAGKIDNWSKVRAAPDDMDDHIIRPVIRLHCKLRPGHWRRLLDTEEDFDPMAFDAAAIADMLLHVARNPAAIGYAYLWHIQKYREQAEVKILRLDGRDPRDLAVTRDGHYPVYRVFNLTTWEDPPAVNPLAQELVAFVLENLERIDPAYAIVPSTQLRLAGWKFERTELIAEPD